MITEATALDLAKEIAAFLKEKHGATMVLLFGSRAKGTSTPDSDIDIYFEGVPRERYCGSKSLVVQTSHSL